MSTESLKFDDEYLIAIKRTEVAAIVVGIISALFSGSVVFVCIYRYNKLVKGHIFIHYVLMIAFADTLTSLVTSFGFPTNEKLCSCQAFILYFFARISWLYTNALVFQCASVIIFQRKFYLTNYIDFIIWIYNTILQFLPYSTNTSFGMFPFWSGKLRCALKQDNESIEYVDMWNRYTFSFQLMASFTWVVFLTIFIVLYQYRIIKIGQLGFNIFTARQSVDTVLLYPAAMVISWLPSMIYDWIWNSYNARYSLFLNDGILIVDR